MPSKSKKQAKLMAAVAHNAEFARTVGIPQSVGREFNATDRKIAKYAGGGKVKGIQELKTALENWEKNKLPQKGFFSTLDEHIAQAPQKVMPAFQWQNYLKAGRMLDRGGVQFPLKQEELDYGGIPKLSEQFGANTSLHQDQVRDYVRQNRPDLQVHEGKSIDDSAKYDEPGLRFKPSVPNSYEENVTVSPDIGHFPSHFTPRDISWSRTTRHQLPGDQTARLIEEIQSDRHSKAGEKVFNPAPETQERLEKLYKKIMGVEPVYLNSLEKAVPGSPDVNEYETLRNTAFKRTGYRTPEQDQEIEYLKERLTNLQGLWSIPHSAYLKDGAPDLIAPVERDQLNRQISDLKSIPPDAPFKDPRDYATHEIRKQLLNSVADNDRFLALTRGEDQIARYEQGMGNQESRGMQEMYDKVYPSVLAKEAGRYGATGVQDLNTPKITGRVNVRPQAFVDVGAENLRDFLDRFDPSGKKDRVSFNNLLRQYKKEGANPTKIDKAKVLFKDFKNQVQGASTDRDFDQLDPDKFHEAMFDLHDDWIAALPQNSTLTPKSFPAAELTPNVAQRIRDIGVPIFSLGAGAVAAPYYLTPNSEDPSSPQGYEEGGQVQPGSPKTLDYWRAIADSLANAVPFTHDEHKGTQNKFGRGISDALSRVSSGLASQVLTRSPDAPGVPNSGSMHVGTHPGIIDELAAFPELLYSMQDTYSGADPTSYEPEFVKRGVENTDRNYKAAHRGLGLNEPHGFVDYALESLGVMAGQLPIPGSTARKLAALTRTRSKSLGAVRKVLGAGAEWLSPTIAPRVGNYAKGAIFGGTIGGVTDAISPKNTWPAQAMQEVLNEGNMQTPYYIQANSDSTPQGYAGGGKVKGIQELKTALENWEKNKLPQKGFFSTLDEHIAQAPQKVMPAFQWQNYLKAGRMLDRGGVQFPLKQEELDYGGIPKLADKFGANTNLTQDQVRDYVRQNRPDLVQRVNTQTPMNSRDVYRGDFDKPQYDQSGLRFKPSVPGSYQEAITQSPDIGDFSSHFSPQDISWSRTTRHQLPGDQTARLIEEIQSDRHSAAAEKVELPGFPDARKILYDARDSGRMSPSEYSKAYDELLKKHFGGQRTGYRTPEQEQEIKNLTADQDAAIRLQPDLRAQYKFDHENRLITPEERPKRLAEISGLEHRIFDNSSKLQALKSIPPDAPFKDPRDYATHEIRKQLLNSVADNDRFLALTRGEDQIARYEQGMGNQESRGMQEMYDKVYPSVLAKEAGRYGATGVQDLNTPKIKIKSNLRPQAFVDMGAETPEDFRRARRGLNDPQAESKLLEKLLAEYSQAGVPAAIVDSVRAYPHMNLDIAHNAWKRKVIKDNPQVSTKSFPAAELTPEVAQRIRDIGVPIFSLGAGAVAAPYYLTPNSEDPPSSQGYASGGPVDPKIPQLLPTPQGGITYVQSPITPTEGLDFDPNIGIPTHTDNLGYYPLHSQEVLTKAPQNLTNSATGELTRDQKYTPLSPEWYAHYGEGPEHLFLGNQAVNLPNPNFKDNTSPIPQGAIPSNNAPSNLLSGLTLGALAGYDAYKGYQAFSGAPSNTVIPAGPGTPASTGDDNGDASGTPGSDTGTGAATPTPSAFGRYTGSALGAGLGALQVYGGIKAGGLGGAGTALRGAGQLADAANTSGLYSNTYGGKLASAGQIAAGINTGGLRGYSQAAVGASNLANSLGYGNVATQYVGQAAPYVNLALALTGKGTTSQKSAAALSSIYPVLGIPVALQALGAFGRPDMGPEKQQAIHNYAVDQGAVLVPKDPTHPASIDYSDPNSYTLDYTHHYETPADTAARIKADSGGNADLAKLLQQEGDYLIGPGASSSNHIAGAPSAITAINQAFQEIKSDPAKLAELQKIPYFQNTGKTTEQITAEHGGVPWNVYGPISSLYWTPAQKALMASRGIYK